MQVRAQLHTPAALPPTKQPSGTYWLVSWLCPRGGLDTVTYIRIPCPCRELNRVQPVSASVQWRSLCAVRYIGYLHSPPLPTRIGSPLNSTAAADAYQLRCAASLSVYSNISLSVCLSKRPCNSFTFRSAVNNSSNQYGRVGGGSNPR
jgi:hypothetical protein